MIARRCRRVFSAVLVILGVFGIAVPSTVFAEKYPNRPITMIVPWGVGGGGDRVGRVIANFLQSELGVSVPVVNVTGASGQVGLGKVMSEPADGYNIIEITSDTYILLAGVRPRYRLSEFTPLAVVDRQPSGFFVREDSPWKSWSDVLQVAKTKEIKVAGSGLGTQSDVTVSALDKALGLKLTIVPFQKPGMRWTSLLGGHSDMLYAQFGDLTAYLNSHQLRPVLAFADQRLPEYPEIPTAKELGYKVTITHFRAFAVKQGTPMARVRVLERALTKASESREYKEMLQSEAASPDSFIAAPKAEKFIASWVKDVHQRIAPTN